MTNKTLQIEAIKERINQTLLKTQLLFFDRLEIKKLTFRNRTMDGGDTWQDYFLTAHLSGENLSKIFPIVKHYTMPACGDLGVIYPRKSTLYCLLKKSTDMNCSDDFTIESYSYPYGPLRDLKQYESQNSLTCLPFEFLIGINLHLNQIKDHSNRDLIKIHQKADQYLANLFKNFSTAK